MNTFSDFQIQAMELQGPMEVCKMGERYHISMLRPHRNNFYILFWATVGSVHSADVYRNTHTNTRILNRLSKKMLGNRVSVITRENTCNGKTITFKEYFYH